MRPRYLGSGPFGSLGGSDPKTTHQLPSDAQRVGAAFQTGRAGAGPGRPSFPGDGRAEEAGLGPWSLAGSWGP